MTNEEAKEHLKDILADVPNDKCIDWIEALNQAIKALEQQPNRCDSCVHSEEQDGSNCYECVKGMADNFETRSTDADCISRVEALDAIEKEKQGWEGSERYAIDECHTRITELPSITPKGVTITDFADRCRECGKQKAGKWIDNSKEDGYYANCSHCGYQIDIHYERGYLNYCPNCGADMRGESK